MKYVWHSEKGENTCEKCKALDGKVFYSDSEIPERPHPNCKCYVEVIFDSINNVSNLKPINVNISAVNEVNYSNIIDLNKTNAPRNKNKDTSTGNSWIMPCNGNISSPYGWRIHPTLKTRKFHDGIDIAVPTGTPVKAIANGTVVRAGRADGYGYFVVIDHGKINGVIVTSEYGHISSWNVKAGQKVTRGQVVAKSGNTGWSTGPHLHVTIREGSYKGQSVDPRKYIPF